jgi:hypothetical protein
MSKHNDPLKAGRGGIDKISAGDQKSTKPHGKCKKRSLDLAERQAKAIPYRKQKPRAIRTMLGHLRDFLTAPTGGES